MGKDNESITKPIIGNDETKGARNQADGNPNPAAAASGAAGGRTETPKSKPLEPYLVGIPGGKEGAEPVKRGRGRPPGSTTKNNPASKQAKAEAVNPQDVAILIHTSFGILSMKLGDHWRIHPKEAQQIAEPLARILARMGVGEGVSKYSDGVALLLAVLVVVGPRVTLTMQLAKEKKKAKEAQPQNARQYPTTTQPAGHEQEGKTNPAGRTNDRPTTVNGPRVMQDLLPALA
jgi:hypothetical protein